MGIDIYKFFLKNKRKHGAMHFVVTEGITPPYLFFEIVFYQAKLFSGPTFDAICCPYVPENGGV